MRALVWLIFVLLLGLLFLVLLIPVSLDFFWCEEEEPRLILRLFYIFRIRLLPQKKKRPPCGDIPSKEDEKNKKTPQKQERKLLKRDFLDQVGLICEAVKTLSGRVINLIRHVLVKELKVQLQITGEDAAGTAMEYGKVCSYLAASYAFLQNFLRFGTVRFEVTPDFTASESGVRQQVATTVCLRPIFILQTLLVSLVDVIKLALRAKNKRPGIREDTQKQGRQEIKQ